MWETEVQKSEEMDLFIIAHAERSRSEVEANSNSRVTFSLPHLRTLLWYTESTMSEGYTAARVGLNCARHPGTRRKSRTDDFSELFFFFFLLCLLHWNYSNHPLPLWLVTLGFLVLFCLLACLFLAKNWTERPTKCSVTELNSNPLCLLGEGMLRSSPWREQ